MSTERMISNYVMLARSCNHLMLHSLAYGVRFDAAQYRDMRDYYMQQARWEKKIK